MQITASQLGNNIYEEATCQTTCSQILQIVNNPTYPLTIIDNKTTDITIYPNPANNLIYIKTTKIYNSTTYKIYDITGGIYELSGMSYQLGIGSYKVDLTALPKGEYILVLYDETGEFLKAEKIIKK